MKTKILSIAIVLISFTLCSYGQYASVEKNSDINSFFIESPLTSLDNDPGIQFAEANLKSLTQVSENSIQEDVEIIYLPGEGLDNPYVILPIRYEVPEVVFDNKLFVEDWMTKPFLSE